MTIAILVYLVGLLPNLIVFLYCLGMTCGAIAYMSVFYSLLEKGKIIFSRVVIFSAIVCFFSFGLKVFIPSEKTAWLMLGGYAVQTAYESEEGQQYRKLIHKKVQEALGDTVEQVKKEK